MTIIQVFDPALCCSTGVCGVDVDQALVGFSADVDWAKQNGAHIERFNLAQQPMSFAEIPVVKAFLERSGAEALPLSWSMVKWLWRDVILIAMNWLAGLLSSKSQTKKLHQSVVPGVNVVNHPK